MTNNFLFFYLTLVRARTIIFNQRFFYVIVNRDHNMNTEGIIAQIARIRESANALIQTELQKRSIKGIVPALPEDVEDTGGMDISRLAAQTIGEYKTHSETIGD